MINIFLSCKSYIRNSDEDSNLPLSCRIAEWCGNASSKENFSNCSQSINYCSRFAIHKDCEGDVQCLLINK